MAKKDYSALPKKSKEKKSDSEQRVCRLIRLMLMLDKGVLNLDCAARECEVNKRTIQRDLKILEAAGVRMCKPKSSNSNYILDPEFRFLNLHISQNNLENFLNTTNAMLNFCQPLDLLNPLQKEFFEMAKNDEERRRIIQENADKDWKVRTSFKQLNSMFLQGETNFTSPWMRLLNVFFADDIFNKIEGDLGFAYRQLQLGEMSRLVAHSARITRRYKDAIKYLNKILTKDPKDAWAWGELAFVYYEMEDMESAIQTLKTGYKKTLEDQLILYLAFLLGEAKQYALAIKYFKNAYSEPDIVLSFSAEMHKQAGKLDLALQEIEQALSIAPNDVYQFQKGRILKALADETEKVEVAAK